MDDEEFGQSRNLFGNVPNGNHAPFDRYTVLVPILLPVILRLRLEHLTRNRLPVESVDMKSTNNARKYELHVECWLAEPFESIVLRAFL